MTIKKLFLLGIYSGFFGLFIGIVCNIWNADRFWININKTSAILLLFSVICWVVKILYEDHKNQR